MAAKSPLQWPPGWPRTDESARQDSKYRFARPGGGGMNRAFWTLVAAQQSLETELQRLGASDVYITTNYPVGRLGGFRDDRRPKDQGVAVYFELNGRPMTMAQDVHQRAEENLRALALAIEAMRTLERHGGGAMMEKAFTGFAALPPPKSPWEVLGLKPGATAAAVNAAWRDLVAGAHPDRPGGSHDRVAEINVARDHCLKLLDKRP